MSHIHHEDWLTMPLAVVIASSIIGLSIYLGAGRIGVSQTTAVQPAPIAVAPTPTNTATAKPANVTSQDHIRGNVGAKVTIVEYSDLECPYCKQFHTTLKQVTSKYNGSDVAWVYRHFPLPMHDKAGKEAEATECAAEQGGNTKFWLFVDRLFEVSPTNNRLEPSELPKIAAHIGLDVPAFEKCLTSGKYKTKVDSQTKEGTTAGVRGTPHSFIVTKNGATALNGAVSSDTLEQKIKEALGK